MQDPASAVRRRAILLVLGEALAFSLVAAMIKLLGGAIPLAEVMLFRNLFALPALMPQAMAHGGWRALRTRAPLGHLQRSGWGLLAMGGSFYGYAHLPLALASALSKLELGISRVPMGQDPRLEPVSSMMIANPFGGLNVGRLTSTHPPMDQRIARLEQMAGYGGNAAR